MSCQFDKRFGQSHCCPCLLSFWTFLPLCPCSLNLITFRDLCQQNGTVWWCKRLIRRLTDRDRGLPGWGARGVHQCHGFKEKHCKYQQESASINKTATTKQYKMLHLIGNLIQSDLLFFFLKSNNKIVYKSKFRGAQQVKIWWHELDLLIFAQLVRLKHRVKNRSFLIVNGRTNRFFFQMSSCNLTKLCTDKIIMSLIELELQLELLIYYFVLFPFPILAEFNTSNFTSLLIWHKRTV